MTFLVCMAEVPKKGDIVETSDAEEEEEIRLSKYVYWKKQGKHRTSEANDGDSPKKRVKVSRGPKSYLFHNSSNTIVGPCI